MNGIIRKTAVVALITVPLSVVGVGSASAATQKQKQTTRVTNSVNNSSTSTTTQTNTSTNTNTNTATSNGGVAFGGLSQAQLFGCQAQFGLQFCFNGFGG